MLQRCLHEEISSSFFFRTIVRGWRYLPLPKEEGKCDQIPQGTSSPFPCWWSLRCRNGFLNAVILQSRYIGSFTGNACHPSICTSPVWSTLRGGFATSQDQIILLDNSLSMELRTLSVNWKRARLLLLLPLPNHFLRRRELSNCRTSQMELDGFYKQNLHLDHQNMTNMLSSKQTHTNITASTT